MTINRLFGYKHEVPWLCMTRKFGIKLGNCGDDWKLESFLDSVDIVVGDVWRDNVNKAALVDAPRPAHPVRRVLGVD